MMQTVHYILKSGANWKGPIQKFKLTLVKRTPKDKISLCMPDTKKAPFVAMPPEPSPPVVLPLLPAPPAFEEPLVAPPVPLFPPTSMPEPHAIGPKMTTSAEATSDLRHLIPRNSSIAPLRTRWICLLEFVTTSAPGTAQS
jgi:Domain of unknown function (DUF4424)